MANENILPNELREAAAALEKRLQLLRVPSFKIPCAKWDSLPADIHHLIPSWIPALLSNYSLVGAGLAFDNHEKHRTWPNLFSFYDPQAFAMTLERNGYYHPLIEFGFFPFANESDGSVWLATIANGPSGTMYLLEHSAWDGSLPAKENGLVYAHKSLAHLLSAMAINNENFEKMENCMWGKLV